MKPALDVYSSVYHPTVLLFVLYAAYACKRKEYTLHFM